MPAVSDANFDEFAKSVNQLIVMMWRPGCPMCERLKPELIRVARELPDVRFLMLNSFDNPRIRDRYEVVGCPTLLLFEGGALQRSLKGYYPKDRVAAWLKTGEAQPAAEPCGFCLAVRRKLSPIIPSFVMRWLEKYDAWRLASGTH
jgi:thioredoxin 1